MEVRCLPSGDHVFGRLVAECVAELRSTNRLTPKGLERVLRAAHPEVRVTVQHELGRGPGESLLWYAYRDGTLLADR